MDNEHVSQDPSSGLPGDGWRTGQDRTRLLATYLWDGRCGHCRQPLIAVVELGIESVPLDVDHVFTRSDGGSDALTNYIASCNTCNRSRQTATIKDDETIRGVFRMRRALIEQFDDMAQSALGTDPAFSEPFWSAVRCAEHGWHVYGSPAHRDCRHLLELPRHLVPFAEEWWSRFGSHSSSVLEAAYRTYKKRGLADLDLWGVLSHLPRYARDTWHAYKLIKSVPTPDHYRSLSPAPMHLLSAFVPLAATNTAASARRRDFAATMELHEHLKNHGIDWLGISRLWTRRQWPSSHLFYHRAAVLKLAAAGKCRSLAIIEDLNTSRDVDSFLGGI